MKKPNIEEIEPDKETMIITRLIGLGETQRRIYEQLKSRGKVGEELQNAYFFHERELEALIKYQKSL